MHLLGSILAEQLLPPILALFLLLCPSGYKALNTGPYIRQVGWCGITENKNNFDLD